MDTPLPPLERLRYGKHRRNYMLVYEPPKGVEPRNEILYFIHGGGWRLGSPDRRRPLVKLFTDLGFGVMMPAYRLTPFASSREINEDTFAAFREALHHPFAKGKRFVIMGESAGGNLGALLTFNKENQQRYNIESDSIAGLISVVGVLDLDPLPDTFVSRDYTGPKDSEVYNMVNPMNLLNKEVETPVLALHGDNDGLVPHASAVNFVQKLNAHKPGYGKIEIIPEGTHVSVATDWYLEDNYERQLILSWIDKVSKTG